ncbi:hypothetical protein NM688_g539 [Phlebia brevispora]|uniref:Uncharacterized protein n=1 Tax=Phlebia brevispora TaxID=194682 RepID=A0ACC1TE65_9APHY|nr:hypothetical protein NM688_g539 [Phlebia brevispora]
MSYYPPTGSTYPYSAYHPQAAAAYHPGTPGAYPSYQYPAQGYGGTWPYTYSYYPPQQPAQPAASTSRAATAAPVTAATTASTTTTTASAAPPVTATAPTTAGATATTATTTAVQPSTATVPPLQRTFSTTQYTYPSYRESIGSTSRGFGKKSSYRGLFTKELRNLMYGFGDDRNPANDTVNVMEEILIEYIIDVCQTRATFPRPADAKKLARMEELLFMQEDIKRARAQFEESEMNQASSFQT